MNLFEIFIKDGGCASYVEIYFCPFVLERNVMLLETFQVVWAIDPKKMKKNTPNTKHSCFEGK